MAENLTNLPDPQKYSIGRGTSDSPRISLFEADGVTPKANTGIVFTFVVSVTLINEAADIDPETDANILLYYTNGNGIVTIDEPGGVSQVNIPKTATYDPADPTVAAKFDTNIGYPFTVIASNGSDQNRVLARGTFIVRAVA